MLDSADGAAKGNSRHSGFERDALDWYVEPDECVDQLLDHEDFSEHLIWDPSCGSGHILDRCWLRGLATVGSDVADRGAKERHDWRSLDFLRNASGLFRRSGTSTTSIICNPPYGRLEANMPRGDTYAERFIRRALGLGAEKVAMIVNGKFLWSERRWRLFMQDCPPTQILFCSERPSMPPGHELPRLIEEGRAYEGGSIDYVWLLWVRGAPPRPPAWLKPSGTPAEAPADLDEDPMFPGYEVLPIAGAPRDGTACMVRGGSNYAAAHWHDGTWWFGHGDVGTRIQLDFEPAEWLRKTEAA